MLYYHGNFEKHTFPNKYYFFSMVWSNENHMCKSAIRAVVQAAANRKYREWTLPYKGFLLQKYNVKTRCRQKTLITDGNVITGIQNIFWSISTIWEMYLFSKECNNSRESSIWIQLTSYSQCFYLISVGKGDISWAKTFRRAVGPGKSFLYQLIFQGINRM